MPQAVTRRSTPLSGQEASATSPTDIAPGPSQIAALTRLGYRSCLTTLGGAHMEFIFMLTRNDETLADAREVYASVATAGVRHFGCKDVGLPRKELEALFSDIESNRHTSYLEVVRESDEGTLAPARAAAEIQPDYLIGGTLIEPVQEIIAGTGIKFFPYVRLRRGHPGLLRVSSQQ